MSQTTKYNELKDVQSEEVYNQLAEFTRIARYAQYNKKEGRRETWEEQVDRVFKMHKVKFYEFWENKEFREAFDYAKNMMLEKRCLGSQRALQFGGPAILNKNARIYNCMATYIDRPRVFQEIMYSLLCGVGMGFSVQLHHINKLPDIEIVESKGFTSKNVDIIIEDSIEGWADAIGALLSAYFVENQPFPKYYGSTITFDFSLIRPKGANISHMGGKAPGPDGLKVSMEKIRKVLDNCVSKGFSKLRPIDAYDILMHCSDAVLSGGIRRAATLALFSLEDEDMMKAKTGNWFIDNPQRGRSNNSVLLLRDKVDKEKYMKMIESVKQFGEPGMIWVDSTENLFNPCVPDNTFIQTSDGVLQVKDLIKKSFTAIVDGKEYECKTGFVKTGENRTVWTIHTEEGDSIQATSNHKFMTEKRGWQKLDDLNGREKLKMHSHTGKKYTTICEISMPEICDVYDCTVEDVHAFDANGFYVHNCVEIGLYAYDKHGNSGTQACNLSEINMKIVKTPDDFYDACKAGSIIGTLQAAYTDFPYLGKVTESIVREEALIGVSMTGMMETPKIAFSPEILAHGAKIVRETNKRIAALIGINQSARTTCVKPAGSTSCILSTSSGIHPHHGKRYFRRVQANKMEGPLNHFRKYNPQAVEESVWSANKTDDVVTFLCKANSGSLIKEKVSALNLLEKVKLVQKYWVTEGRNKELCVQPWLNHNVSNTITINPDEWEDVTKFIYKNRNYFAGISMLSSSGDMIYQQAPFQAVYTHEEIAQKYGAGSVFASGLIVHAHNAFDGNLFQACSCFLGQGEKLEMPEFNMDNIKSSFVDTDVTYKKIRWVAQAQKFTQRHFQNDKLKMTHCLKSVDAWKKWCDLKRTYKPVIWEDFYEKKDNTKHTEVVACSGNSCEVVRF